MIHAKGAKILHCIARLVRRLAVHGFVILALVVLLPFAANAATSGTWQAPLSSWLVDGYYFGQWVDYLGRYHLGDDAHGQAGTAVYAPANGHVAALFNFPGPYNWGQLILLEHSDIAGRTVISLHGHLDPDTVQVQENQNVSRGQLIGYLGDEAENGGWVPHLHWGIRNGAYVDPSQGWVYYGYGTAEQMASWFNPSAYVESHKNIIEVLRVPDSSPNRYTTAVGVSQRVYPTKGSAEHVYLASGLQFADALTAAALAQKDSGPILLTTKDKLPAETSAEILRVLAKDGSVTLLGGEQAISGQVALSIEKLGFKTARVAGPNRETTAVAVAGRLPQATSAFVVNRAAFSDAVSAGGPANLLGIPLLFSDGTKLNPVTQQYLAKNTAIAKVYLVGGESVMGSAVQQ
ncbi:MAG: cell wall-binding repeat-containing protein, partial [Parcubacteria group bacterium]